MLQYKIAPIIMGYSEIMSPYIRYKQLDNKCHSLNLIMSLLDIPNKAIPRAIYPIAADKFIRLIPFEYCNVHKENLWEQESL